MKKISVPVFLAMMLLMSGILFAHTAAASEAVIAQGITMDQRQISLYDKSTATIGYTLSPGGATADIKWKSNKTSVATVDQSGTVTALKSGSAVITATLPNGKNATCTVKVNATTVMIMSGGRTVPRIVHNAPTSPAMR